MPIMIAGSLVSFQCLKMYTSAKVTPESRICNGSEFDRRRRDQFAVLDGQGRAD